ncbi:mfp1 attachment factor 1 [Phtheirospermum japonicum]|uniref:Mfp1 attachment factor 1 n=1 Tax=Phtheirospermum japonicum TaxID=374723 RepID=A0A830BF88_9LAMI|nr:mfp1 attachment factor 1 [Phtheirospermum japonicum]
MAETEQSPPQSETTTTTTAAVAEKFSNVSFNIWPPSDRTRDAVRKRLIETLSSPSILSKRYGTVSHEEAVEAAKVIEEEAFEVAGKAASTDDGGIEILQVYSKEISRRMLDKVKVRSGDLEAPPAATPVNDEPSKAEEEDAGSTAPPQSEKTESVADDE